MEKKEFRAEAKLLGKVVSEIEETKDKKTKLMKYTLKASNILGKSNNCLKLGTQTTYTYQCSSLEDILEIWGKKPTNPCDN